MRTGWKESIDAQFITIPVFDGDRRLHCTRGIITNADKTDIAGATGSHTELKRVHRELRVGGTGCDE